MAKEKSKHLTSKEIGIALNNAVSASFGYPALKDVSEGRKRQLRNYLSAILDSVLAHRKDGHLTAEELVTIFSSGALFIHVMLVSGGGANKLPQYQDMAANMVEDQNDNRES